ncbi:MAG: histidinol-phosphatase HisJ family protein [Ruminococcaceae bacterium]|nr:histidinol-phosphatase HisJ family protein [Oscillospiraceae bacterium]
MKYNYHTHTALCHHAVGTNEEYVLAAIKAGFDEIGFADHSPWDFKDYVSNMRMAKEDLPAYCESIKALREKYKDKISIKLGLECEYFPKYLPWLKDMIAEHGIDFLILGHHFSVDEPISSYNGNLCAPHQLYDYRDDILEAMDTGLFSYVAHPDIFMRGYPVFDNHCRKITEDIILKSIATGVPLEYNLLGYSHSINDGKEGYPYPDFWKMIGEMKPPVTMGIDAHYPEAYLDSELYQRGLDALSALGLSMQEKIKMLGE